jgi:hypothetical protein
VTAPFPFGLSGPSALYLGLYVITLAIHVVFLSYVLSGAGWVAIATAAGRGRGPVASLLRDWLPFGLGAAITAGVAPLLFVQVLYQERFYTANLLLFHRWMAIVPVLIVGFYALYLGKSERVAGWGRAGRTAVAMVAWGAFLFTAWSFTENHLLALDRAAWVDFYARGEMLYRQSGVLPRLGIWIGGALPVMAAAVAWQLLATVRDPDERARAMRPLALVALAGLGIAAAAALL